MDETNRYKRKRQKIDSNEEDSKLSPEVVVIEVDLSFLIIEEKKEVIRASQVNCILQKLNLF